MTYIVSGGALNSTHSLNCVLSVFHKENDDDDDDDDVTYANFNVTMTHYNVQFKSAIPELGRPTVGSLEQERFQRTFENRLCPVQLEVVGLRPLCRRWLFLCRECPRYRSESPGRPVSSAYFTRLLMPGLTACKSASLTTYRAGPIIEPWMMLAFTSCMSNVWPL